MYLRKATISDLKILQKIGERTFIETFASENSSENMTVYLESAFTTEKLKNELTNINSEFYFAEIDGKVVGYFKVNFNEAQTELKMSNAMEIERIYVLKDFQGMKVGKMLFDKAIENARNMGLDLVWLGVWEKNIRAISFYEKNGFTVFNKHIFRLGNEEQIDLMMMIKL
jgi:ribosomal protein S18 acetylase RimI-like enzyme